MPAGRPTLYKAEFADQARKLAHLGATDRDLAEFFNVAIRTIRLWMVEHPEFMQAIKAGKDEADNRVERSLFQRAVGYDHDAVKIFNDKGTIVTAEYVEHVPPDTTAAIFWMKNRKREEWNEKREDDGRGGINVVIRGGLPDGR